MRWKLLAVWMAASATSAWAIDGTVFNATRTRPQGGATVSLFRVTQNGPEMLTSTKSAADGTFQMTPPAGSASPGPRLVQAVYGGVTYNKMIPPGQPDTGVRVDVFESTAKPGTARVSTHMMLLEPVNGQLSVSESFVFSNGGNVTYNDPDRGTLQFYLPAPTQGKAQLNVLSPGSVSIRRSPEKTDKPDVYKVDFPIKPGESRVDLAYQIPFTTPGEFVSSVLFRDPNTKVLAPQGVVLSGNGVNRLGDEPRTKASIYNIDGPELRIGVAGTGALARGGEGGEDAQGGEGGGSQIAELLPQLYGKVSPVEGLAGAVQGVKWVLALVVATLTLTFLYLYRRSA